MSKASCRVDVLAGKQHEVVAGWQLQAGGFTRSEIDAALRGLRRVHRDVCALGDLTELGWYMAAALALGPGAAVSHLSALMLLGLRPFEPGDIHVSYIGGGRNKRGIVPHRRRGFEAGTCHGIPVTSPTQSLKDATLEPHELYRALEEADRRNLKIDRSRLLKEVVRIQRAIRGRTRSDAEARFIMLIAGNHLPLPLVNHRLNGFETDFHWPDHRLVVEVDGYEFHSSKQQFEEDRRRGLIHTAAGYTVTRISANQVRDEPELVLAALGQTTGW